MMNAVKRRTVRRGCPSPFLRKRPLRWWTGFRNLPRVLYLHVLLQTPEILHCCPRPMPVELLGPDGELRTTLPLSKKTIRQLADGQPANADAVVNEAGDDA